MLKVNLNDPIPNFIFTRLKKDDGARYFGPFREFRRAAQHAGARAAAIQSARLPRVHARRERITNIASTRT